MSMFLTKRLWVMGALALWLGGCGAPPPKPVIMKPAESVQEEAMLKLAEKDYADALKSMQGMKYKEAEKQLLEMTEKYPTLSGPFANLAIVYMETKRPKEAEEAFKKAVGLNSKVPAIFNQMGYFYRENGRFEDARQAYEGAISADPGYAKAHLNLGVLYDLYLMDSDKALKSYMKFAEITKPATTEPVMKWIADLSARAKKAVPPAPAPEAAAPQVQ